MSNLPQENTSDEELELVKEDIGGTILSVVDKPNEKPKQMFYLEVNPIGLNYLNLLVMFLTRFSVEINESIIL